jgi:hypothetical protein
VLTQVASPLKKTYVDLSDTPSKTTTTKGVFQKSSRRFQSKYASFNNHLNIDAAPDQLVLRSSVPSLQNSSNATKITRSDHLMFAAAQVDLLVVNLSDYEFDGCFNGLSDQS